MKKEKIIPDEIALITGNNKRIYNSRRRTVSSLIKEAFTIIFEKEEMANLKIESFMFRIYKNKDIKPFLHKLVAPVGHDNLKDFKTITLQENRSSNTFVALKPLEQAVVDSICKTHKVLINEIRTKRKPREYVDARYQIFHILNRICGYKLVDIGLIFNKNHASIISGLKNHQSFVFFENNHDFDNLLKFCKQVCICKVL
jgi:hypothetical protein